MWRCAYLQAETAAGLARFTLDFYERCKPDLLVLTPSPYYLAEAWGADVRSFRSDALAPILGRPLIDHPTGWRRLPVLDLSTSSLCREIDAVRLVRAQLAERGAPLVVQIPSPLATADALCSGRILSDLRTYPGDVRAALQTIAAQTARFLDTCLEAGADGYLFVSPFASRDRMRPREFRAFGLTFDLQALGPFVRAPIRILYLETGNPDLSQARHYPAQAVGWQGGSTSSSLAGADEMSRFTWMGGLDPLTFSSGSLADLERQVGRALAHTGGWRLLLAPGGPLPADAPKELLAAVGTILDKVQPLPG
jgi:uroporphyrinogen-III decarboxylase